MLSISPVSAGAAASGYYKEEGYYQAGTDEAREAARWFGKASAGLGLTGHVDDAQFTSFLDGQDPDGNLLGRVRGGEREHRPGLDLTFSASKTASIAALAFGDNRVVEAHDRAVLAAMSVVEERFIFTRRQENGEKRLEHAAGIIAGIYRHDTSRALDPNLHSHAVITNVVRNDAGGYTAMVNDAVYRNQKLVTEIYRSEFERELQRNGVRTERGRYGEVNVAAVPQALADMFSTRRKEILTALEKEGRAASPANAAWATLATRVAKHKEVDRDALRSDWKQDMRIAGFDVDRLQADLRGMYLPPLGRTSDRIRPVVEEDGFLARIRSMLGLARDATAVPSVTAAQGPQDAVSKAVDHLSERTTTYSRADLTIAAMAFSRDGRFESVDREISHRLENGALLTNDPRGHWLTDKASVLRETELLRSWRNSQTTPGLSLIEGKDRGGEGGLEKRVADAKSLTEGQKDAISTALTGRGRYVGIQGYAGTGKTFMLDRLTHYAGLSDYKVKAFAPSHQAVEELSKVVGSAQTVQGLLMAERNHPQPVDNSKTILVIDEASMIGTQDMRDLMVHAERTGAPRVVMVGDTQQLDAVDSGQPFDLLQKGGMRVAVMDEIRRQEDPDLRASVYQTIRGEIGTAFETLAKSVVQSEAYLAETARRYLELSPEERAGTRVLTTTNAARSEINAMIREGLRTDGSIGTDVVEIDGLTNRNLTAAQRTDARFYRVGDIVQATANSTAHGLHKGYLYEVTAADPGRNTLTLQSEVFSKASTLPLGDILRRQELGKSLAVFETETRHMAPGDRIRFRISDAWKDVTNGQRGEIVSAAHGSLTIRMEGSEETRMLYTRSTAVRGMEHDYAATAHAAQGESVDRVIVAMGSSEQLANRKSFYVDISRARHSATLVTDDAERLAKTIERETGERQHALNLVDRTQERTAYADSDGYDRDVGKRNDKDHSDLDMTRDDDRKPGEKPGLTEQEVLRTINDIESRAEKILTREKQFVR